MVVDAHGRAMHKSDGNSIEAVEGMEQYGADVLRLWAASTEYTADMRLGAEMLKNAANVYRNLRNRLRFFLSAVSDLPADAVVPRAALEPLDRLALAALDRLAKDVVAHYRAFRLHDAYLALVTFDNDDLSRFYIAALKDRLYSSAADAPRRRSAQSALLTMLRTLAVLLAPVLSFTAEEAWQALPPALRREDASVFDIAFPRVAELDSVALADWQLLKDLRAQVAASGAVDFALDASVVVPAEAVPRLAALGDNLREALIVSTLLGVDAAPDGSATVHTQAADGEKCARCWKYLPLGSDADHPTICAACAEIVRRLAA
jgi:isoleucyl-tRNA synthetase